MSDIRMTFGHNLEIDRDYITNSVYYKAGGVFQFAIKLRARYQTIKFFTNAVDSFPDKYSFDRWSYYKDPNPKLIAYAYNNDNSAFYNVFNYMNSSADTGILTCVMNFVNNSVEVYNSSGNLLKNTVYDGMAKLHGKMMAMTIQACDHAAAIGYAWFWDGSPGNEMPYLIDGIPTLYQHLNTISYDCYEKDKIIYGIKKA